MTAAPAIDVFAEIRRKRENVDLHDLARRMAHGESVDPEQVDYACIVNHKDISDFESLVAIYRRREQRRQEYARVSELRDEQAELKAQIEQANEELEAAVARHRDTTYPLQARIRDVEQEIQSLGQIPRELRESCPDKRLEEKLGELRIHANSIQHQVHDAERQLRSQQAALSTAADRARIKLSTALNSEWLGHAQYIDLDATIDDDDPLAVPKRRVLTAARKLQQVRDRQHRIREQSDALHERKYEL